MTKTYVTVEQVIFRGANFRESQREPSKLNFVVFNFVKAYKYMVLRMCR